MILCLVHNANYGQPIVVSFNQAMTQHCSLKWIEISVPYWRDDTNDKA